MLTPSEIADLIVGTLDNKKAQEIKLLRTREITILADFFVICTASSTVHLKTLSDEVELKLKASGEQPLRREGQRTGGWILIDFGAVVVHLFTKEARDFYTLERLWGDAEDIDITQRIMPIQHVIT